MSREVSKMVIAIYTMRSQLTSGKTLWWSRVAGLGVVAVALLLIVEDRVAMGSVALLAGVGITWLAGVWVAPWSLDAYSRKMSFIMRDTYADLWYEEGQRAEALGAILSEIENFVPPQQYLNIHRRILSSLYQVVDAVKDRSATFTDRAVLFSECRHVLLGIQAELNDHLEGVYIRKIAMALPRYDLLVTGFREKIRESLQRHLARVDGIKPPEVWAARHEKYLNAMSVHISAISSYVVAARGDDLGVVKQTALAVTKTHSALEAERGEFATDLRLMWMEPWSTRQVRQPRAG